MIKILNYPNTLYLGKTRLLDYLKKVLLKLSALKRS